MLKKFSLKSVSDFLSDKALKNVIGGYGDTIALGVREVRLPSQCNDFCYLMVSGGWTTGLCKWGSDYTANGCWCTSLV